jgi:hypothetical protein
MYGTYSVSNSTRFIHTYDSFYRDSTIRERGCFRIRTRSEEICGSSFADDDGEMAKQDPKPKAVCRTTITYEYILKYRTISN